MKARYRVRWAFVAQRDLIRILEYLADRNPGAARRTLEDIETRAARLAFAPLRGRLVPELVSIHVREYREIQAPPYRLVYRVIERRVTVLAVFDSRRNLEDVLLDRLLGDR